LALSLFIALGHAGCRNSADGDGENANAAVLADPLAPPAERPIEVLSWWTQLGDEDAFGKLIAAHHRVFPQDLIINATVAHAGQARRTLSTRIAHGDPPDVFQANVGSDLMQWVFLNGVDGGESRLLALDDLVEGVETFRHKVPTALLAHATYQGKLYGIPSNIERVNSLYCSKKIFARLHLSPPTTLEELTSVAQKLRAAGLTPLTLGSRQAWPAVMLVFECLLVAREGPRFYQDYFQGHLAADDPRISRTLEAALKLFAFVNPDHAQLSWTQAAEALISGRAGMMPGGDWSRLLFKVNGWTPDRDYVEIPFPGTAKVMVFTSDVFALPRDARNQPGARRWLATMASRDGQRVLNEVKGQLAARFDVSLPAYADASTKEKLALMEQGSLLLALSGLVPRRFSEDLGEALSEMLALQDIEPVLQTLRSRYTLLKQ